MKREVRDEKKCVNVQPSSLTKRSIIKKRKMKKNNTLGDMILKLKALVNKEK